jgi:hypothetical protein
MRLPSTAVAFALVIGSGCGDDGPTVSDICDEQDGVFVAYFQKIFSCFPEYAFFVGGLPTSAEIAEGCAGSIQPYLDDGTVKINGAIDLAACREFIEMVDCATLNDADTTPCDDLLIGTLEVGAECSGNDQCLGDAFCDKAVGSDCGVCRAEKLNGAACAENEECASDFCHPQTDVCAERAEAGEACASKDDCGGTRVCSPTTSTCVDEPTWSAGTPCRDFIDCDVTQSGLYCDPEMMQCRAFLALDDSCGLGTALCNFFEDEYCGQMPAGSGEYRCRAATPSVAEGGQCNPFTGQACVEGLLCRDHDEVESTPQICIRQRDLGEACNETDQPCMVFLECVGGMCQYGSHTDECAAP